MAKGSGHIRRAVVRESDDAVFQGDISRSVVQDATTLQKASSKLNQLVDDLLTIGHPTEGKPIKLGDLDPQIAFLFQQRTGIQIRGQELYVSAKSITHHRTGEKLLRGKVVPYEDFRNLAQELPLMDIYLSRNGLVFTDNVNKFVFEPNRVIKIDNSHKKVCFHLSSSRITDLQELSRYEVLRQR